MGDNLREKLFQSIDKTVDEKDTLCAEFIADGIIEDVKNLNTDDGFAQGVVYACARLIEIFDAPTLAVSIFKTSEVNPKNSTEYDLAFLREEMPDLPKGIE